MNNNQGNTPLTPAQRAALAEAREFEAQKRKYASSAVSTHNNIQSPQRQTAWQRPVQQIRQAQQPVRMQNENQKRPPVRQGSGAVRNTAYDTREYPKNMNSQGKQQPNRRPLTNNPNPANQNKEDTGEYPSYIRATKKGGYHPSKVKQRHVTKIHRKKLDPYFKAVLFAVGAFLALLLILMMFGVRYSSQTLKSDGSKVKFFGTAKDGEPYNGWLSYSTGEKGSLKEGKRIEYSDGSVYTGPTDDGLRIGQGTMTYKDGSVYKGSFSDNKKNGYGVMTYENGDVYEGYFVNDKREGQGTMTYADGSTYVGAYKNDRKNGRGIMTTIGESVYDGNYIDDIKSGYGVQTFVNGDRYEGNFKNDMRNGEGIYYFANNDRYEGNFKNSSLSGKGKYFWSTGKVYEGMFENGQPVE